MIQHTSLTFAYHDSQSSTEPVEVAVDNLIFELDSENAYYDDERNTYVIAFTVQDGVLNYLSKSEAIQAKQPKCLEISTTTYENSTVNPCNVGWWDIFHPTTQSQVSGEPMKVTADYIAPNAGGSVSKSLSFTITEEFSGGISTAAKTWIRTSIEGSYTWVKSKSYSSTYTANLLKGESGYLSFTPYYIRVEGYYETWVNAERMSRDYCYGDSVKLVDSGDEPDGVYEFIYY